LQHFRLVRTALLPVSAANECAGGTSAFEVLEGIAREQTRVSMTGCHCFVAVVIFAVVGRAAAALRANKIQRKSRKREIARNHQDIYQRLPSGEGIQANVIIHAQQKQHLKQQHTKFIYIITICFFLCVCIPFPPTFNTLSCSWTSSMKCASAPLAPSELCNISPHKLG
jgi:hypothetical protein